MEGGGLSREESLDLLRAFRDFWRAEKRADPPATQASLARIRGLYSRILAGYPPGELTYA